MTYSCWRESFFLLNIAQSHPAKGSFLFSTFVFTAAQGPEKGMVQHFSLGTHLQSNIYGFEVEVDWKNIHQSALSSQTASVKQNLCPTEIQPAVGFKTLVDFISYFNSISKYNK